MTNRRIMFERQIPTVQYGYDKITVYSDLEEGETVEEALEAIRKELTVEVRITKSLESPKTETTGKVKKSKQSPVAEVEEDEEEEDEIEIEDDEIEEEEEEEVAPKKSAKKSPEADAPKKKLRKQDAVYDRNLELHKKLVGEMLTQEFPKWREKMANTAKQVSAKMSGKEFLDSEGEIRDDFRENFVKLMKKVK